MAELEAHADEEEAAMLAEAGLEPNPNAEEDYGEEHEFNEDGTIKALTQVRQD
jgi:hypothetical protein